jgi:hypothetical protein
LPENLLVSRWWVEPHNYFSNIGAVDRALEGNVTIDLGGSKVTVSYYIHIFQGGSLDPYVRYWSNYPHSFSQPGLNNKSLVPWGKPTYFIF